MVRGGEERWSDSLHIVRPLSDVKIRRRGDVYGKRNRPCTREDWTEGVPGHSTTSPGTVLGRMDAHKDGRLTQTPCGLTEEGQTVVHATPESPVVRQDGRTTATRGTLYRKTQVPTESRRRWSDGTVPGKARSGVKEVERTFWNPPF